MAASTVDVESFLVRYGEAQAESAEATAALWTLPAMLVDLYDAPMVFERRADLVAALAPAYPVYERIGLATIALLDAETTDVTPTLVRARTRWSFRDGDGEELCDPVFEYTLRHEAAGLHVSFAVAIDLAPKLAAVGERLGIDLG